MDAGRDAAGPVAPARAALALAATVTGYLGLGSNVGDRRANLQAAVDALPRHGVRVLGVLLDLRHRPGRRGPRPARVPQRLRADRDRARPRGAARRVQGGRARARAATCPGGVRHGPRPIDVDLLLLGDREHRSERLRCPTSRYGAPLRAIPLLELDLDLATPDGARLADALAALALDEGVRRAGRPLRLPTPVHFRAVAWKYAPPDGTPATPPVLQPPPPTIDRARGPLRVLDTGARSARVRPLHGPLVDGAPVGRRGRRALHGPPRCVVPDLPLGSHRTPMRGPRDLTPRGVAALLAGFSRRSASTTSPLVANDTGGAITQLVATERPARFARGSCSRPATPSRTSCRRCSGPWSVAAHVPASRRPCRRMRVRGGAALADRPTGGSPSTARPTS